MDDIRCTPVLTGIQEAVHLAGGQVALAEALGVKQQAVSVWARRGYVPVRRVIEIEALFGIDRSRLIDPRLGGLFSDSGLGE